ncbi:hypothetical protein E1262_13880 [Jiangella aurantiaca]|uniref:Uncharacterized protein n=1 Tax=Jiangella aurantiaca TaxID=2530373 RepID=A0A4V6PEH1_9ACTN|nr:hypothetical protein [Jiangella aurantiaca]TDD69107.1 hypothetical protein E1262_13880 [Jiangella aurantiaca]
MKITTLNPSVCGVGFAYERALGGVSLSTRVRSVAPVTAPMTGEVRPQAGDAQTAHLVDGVKSGVRVRTWGPPV